MPILKQPSFTGGEIAPSLQSRTDLEKYYTSLSEARNVFIHIHGGVSNMAGTKHIGVTYDATRATILVPFEFNTQQTYMLEFSHNRLRVIKDGGYVINGGSPYNIASPYASTDLALLKFVQSADVLYITHPSYAPRSLSRTAHDNWTFSTLSFTPSQSAPTSITVTNSFGAGTYTRRYRVTAVSSGGEESQYATGIGTNQANDTSWTEGETVTVGWTVASGADHYNIYKETADGNGIYGFIGEATGATFIDTKIQPDATDSPPTWVNPFGTANNYPYASSFFEQRWIAGGTNNAPETYNCSVTGGFNNFSKSRPMKADDAIEATIPSRKVNEIRHFVPLNNLLIFTSGSEWSVSSGDDAFAFDTIRQKMQSEWGCSHVPPIVIGNEVIFVQSSGSVVRSFGYSLDVDGYKGSDLTILAPHFFRNRQIISWCFAQIPLSLVFAVRDDGKLLVLTYMPEQQIWGWSLCETNGLYESVATVREGNEDAVYFVIKRYINGAWTRHIERLQTRYFEDVRDAFFVHDGLSYDNPRDIEGVTKANPAVVTSTGHGFDNGDMVDIFDVVGMTELNGKRFEVANKTADTFELKGINSSSYTAYISGGTVRDTVSTVSGLDHLEGESVSCLCDGNVVTGKVVDSGAISFDRAYSRIHVGLPYSSRIKTLAVDLSNGATNGKKRRIPKVFVQLEKTRGLKLGTGSLEELIEMKDREFEGYSEPTAMFTGTKPQATSSTWDRQGQVIIQQDYPLPMTVTAILPEVDIGG